MPHVMVLYGRMKIIVLKFNINF